ncbi:MAG: hypothetical protein WCV84_04675 [Patescibacteria group bacterium]
MSTTDDKYEPKTGLRPDPLDERDFLYEDVMGADAGDLDWEKGFNVYEELGLPYPHQDQGRSYSCVAQSTAEHTRVWWKKLTGEDIEFSPRFIYPQIALGYAGGAYLRDGVHLVASKGVCDEGELPSYENGQPPSEDFMFNAAAITPDILAKALPHDRFNFRVILGGTDDISLFAHAIRFNCGVVGGFKGTNIGWCRSEVRAPQAGEDIWGHAVLLCAYGMHEGKRCMFTRNSWGGRYTIQEGRWKGLQAIPEEYFTAGVQTAVGEAKGVYVFNSWVLVPDSKLTPAQKTMDFLKKNEGKLVQDSQGSGAFGIVKGGKILVASKERVAELLATYIVRKEGVGVAREMWADAPKEDF